MPRSSRLWVTLTITAVTGVPNIRLQVGPNGFWAASGVSAPGTYHFSFKYNGGALSPASALAFSAPVEFPESYIFQGVYFVWDTYSGDGTSTTGSIEYCWLPD